MDSKPDNTPIPKSDSWQMFDEISSNYDFLNHLLSFGLDIHWRTQLAKFASNREKQKVLDLATGTGDVLISLFKDNPNIHLGVGLDLADKMMEIGRQKIVKHELDWHITFQHGDAHKIPFESNFFDLTSIAFGIRNMEKPDQVLREMYRVLNLGGKSLILEFSLPQNAILRSFHLCYLRYVVPAIGGFFSGNTKAYRYLNQTIETFPYGEDFCGLMSKAGFNDVDAHPLLFGVATIYTGNK